MNQGVGNTLRESLQYVECMAGKNWEQQAVVGLGLPQCKRSA